MSSNNIVFYGIAEFILDRKDLVVEFLNRNGYAELPFDTPIDEVNKAVARNLLNDDFIAEFLLFQRRVEEGAYSNIIVAIATAVSIVAQTVSGIIQGAKNRVFGEAMMRRQEQYGREWQEFEKEQVELKARKEISIELGKAQTDIILRRDMAEEDAKMKNNLMIFGVAVAGAIVIAYMVKNNKTK